MQKISSLGKVYVKKSDIPDSGRGVFAGVNIKKGEVVEECPMIEIPKDELSRISEGVLVNYIFFFGKNKEKAALALGFGSLYNHSDKPNVVYKIKHEEEKIEFDALNDIKKYEELTINYKDLDSPGKKIPPLWFEK
jgi:SET domain-containing protein